MKFILFLLIPLLIIGQDYGTRRWHRGDIKKQVVTDSLDADKVVVGALNVSDYADVDSIHGDHIVSDNQVSADSIEADHIVGTVHVNTDSIDAQHGVFDIHINTDSVYTEHLMVNDNAYFGDTVDVEKMKAVRFLPRTPQPIVSFVFDDQDTTIYTRMRPLFTSRDIVGALAVSTGLAENNYAMGWVKIKEMYDDGWEVMNHTKTHARLDTCTKAQIIAELLGADTAFVNNGIIVKNFAYPGGMTNDSATKIVSGYFRSARGTESVYNTYPLKTYHLAGRGIDNHTLLATYQALVDAIETGDGWLIFYSHGGDADDETTLGSLLDYIQAKDIPILTVDQALDLIENPVQLGDRVAVGIEGGLVVNAAVMSKTLTLSLGTEAWGVVSGTQNTLSAAKNSPGKASFFDSLYCDSVAVAWYATEDSNIIDSFYVGCWGTRTYVNTAVVQDGTDKESGSVGYKLASYTGLDVVIPLPAKMIWKFKPGAESAANKTVIYNVLLYGRLNYRGIDTY